MLNTPARGMTYIGYCGPVTAEQLLSNMRQFVALGPSQLIK